MLYIFLSVIMPNVVMLIFIMKNVIHYYFWHYDDLCDANSLYTVGYSLVVVLSVILLIDIF